MAARLTAKAASGFSPVYALFLRRSGSSSRAQSEGREHRVGSWPSTVAATARLCGPRADAAPTRNASAGHEARAEIASKQRSTAFEEKWSSACQRDRRDSCGIWGNFVHGPCLGPDQTTAPRRRAKTAEPEATFRSGLAAPHDTVAVAQRHGSSADTAAWQHGHRRFGVAARAQSRGCFSVRHRVAAPAASAATFGRKCRGIRAGSERHRANDLPPERATRIDKISQHPPSVPHGMHSQ